MCTRSSGFIGRHPGRRTPAGFWGRYPQLCTRRICGDLICAPRGCVFTPPAASMMVWFLFFPCWAGGRIVWMQWEHIYQAEIRAWGTQYDHRQGRSWPTLRLLSEVIAHLWWQFSRACQGAWVKSWLGISWRWCQQIRRSTWLQRWLLIQSRPLSLEGNSRSVVYQFWCYNMGAVMLIYLRICRMYLVACPFVEGGDLVHLLSISRV